MSLLLCLISVTFPSYRGALIGPNVEQPVNMTWTLAMLDAMQALMTGDGLFDRPVYRNLRSCMKSFDRQLPLTQDMVWRGIVQYWNTRGASNDPWGGYTRRSQEHNVTLLSVNSMEIHEPCNFASNLVYYELMNELCLIRKRKEKLSIPAKYVQSLGSAIPFLTTGSCFFHGSNTRLGYQQDFVAIEIVMYLIYQGTISGISNTSSILMDLSLQPRNLSSVELVHSIQEMYRSEPVHKWYNLTSKFDIPDYRLIIAALFLTTMTFNFDPAFVNFVLPRVAGASELSPSHVTFLKDHYSPSIREASRTVQIHTRKINVIGGSLSAFAKLVVALVWRENNAFSNPKILSPIGNFIGWTLFADLNKKINKLNKNVYHKGNLQAGVGIYPGEERCNPRVPHAKWHLQTALFILDLLHLGNNIASLT